MKSNRIIILLLLIFGLSCQSQTRTNFKSKIIETKQVAYGKISPNNDFKLLSEITGINKSQLTSSIYVRVNNNKKEIPINDNSFNHDFFNRYDYKSSKSVKIHIQSYETKTGEILIATKIE